MLKQKLAVFTSSTELFESVRKFVPTPACETIQVARGDGSGIPGVTLALVDGKWQGDLHALLEGLARTAVYTVLVDDEKHIGNSVPETLSAGLVDDLLLTPIRPMELLGKLKHVEHLARVNELLSANSSLKTLIEKFEEDLRTARAIQRSLIPEKFSQVPGLKVTHKYLSGLKSGGDYLDFFEFGDNTHVGILMSDSSGYGLSSAFMSVILKLAMKLSKDEARSPAATVERIFEELSVTMKPAEQLSILYGILNRKTFELVYTGCGSVRLVRQRSGGPGEPGNLTAEPLCRGQRFMLSDRRLQLLPEDRVVLLSDGFADTFESANALDRALGQAYGDDPMGLINEFTFRVKRGLDSDDMPAQDCSVMVIDVEKRAMRLAK
jgi:serine phosphatase RsbU (regulator of sigma subunit)